MTAPPSNFSAMMALALMTIGAASSTFAQTPTAAPADGPKDSDWIQLFNGKDLTGWTPKITKHELADNYANTYRVQNGLLQVRYDKYEKFDGQFGHLFYRTPYSYYRLIVEYRFVGEQAKANPGAWALRNSGAMLHSQDPKTMTRNQDFPISIEAQFLGGNSDGKARSTANVCTPGTDIVVNGSIYTQHCLNSTSKTYDGDQWVTVEVVVLGAGLISQYVNGEKVLEYALPQFGEGAVNNHDPSALPAGKLIEGGYIALQSESHPIDFRKVALLNLQGCMDRKASNYRSYYVKSDAAACKYAGPSSTP